MYTVKLDNETWVAKTPDGQLYATGWNVKAHEFDSMEAAVKALTEARKEGGLQSLPGKHDWPDATIEGSYI